MRSGFWWKLVHYLAEKQRVFACDWINVQKIVLEYVLYAGGFMVSVENGHSNSCCTFSGYHMNM
jgi:hypothetical protein